MTPRVRAVIAYIASRLISGAEPSILFDIPNCKHRSMSGTVNQGCVNVYDFSENCQMTGHMSNGSFQLFHHGERVHVSLEIVAASLRGSDYSTGRQFRGFVNGPRVSIYDDAEHRIYEYWCEAPQVSRMPGQEIEVTEDGAATE